MKRTLKAFAVLPFRLLPNGIRRHVIKAVLSATACQSPREALRTLLQVESDLSGLIDETALAYDNGVHAKHRLTGYHDFFVERVKLGERVLDLGCGYGALAYSLASRAGAIVTGVDLSEGNIALARKRFARPNLSFIVGDASRDIPEGPFDVVVASNILEHVERRVDFLTTVQRQVKPQRWLIRVPMVNRDWRVPLRAELGLFHFSDPTHFTEYTQESFEAEMRDAGMVITHLQINWGEIWAEVAADA